MSTQPRRGARKKKRAEKTKKKAPVKPRKAPRGRAAKGREHADGAEVVEAEAAETEPDSDVAGAHEAGETETEAHEAESDAEEALEAQSDADEPDAEDLEDAEGVEAERDADEADAEDLDDADGAEATEPALETEGELPDEAQAEATGDASEGEELVDGIPRDLLDAPDEDEAAIPGTDSDTRPGLEKARPQSVGEAHLKSVLESLVFVSDKPVPAKRLASVARARTKDVVRLLGELAEDYQGRGIELIEVAGGFQFRSSAANAPFVREIVQAKPLRLSRAQLETLAIAAYRQPLTRPELEEIRGVDSGSALKVLLERGLVKILGRKDEVGRPLLYGTTPVFLEFFGMTSLDELPTLREFSELSDESKALFARKTGEEIGAINLGEVAVPETEWPDEDEDDEDVSGEREDGADERENAADEREDDGDERENASDEREDDADEYEGDGDERENASDEREDDGDEYEDDADEREDDWDEHESAADEHEDDGDEHEDDADDDDADDDDDE